MQIDERSAAAQSNYNDKAYFFCNTHCKQQFEQSPDVFINQTGASIPHHLDRIDSTSPLQTAGQVPGKLVLPIAGMSCVACAQRIEKNLNKNKAVEAAVNFASQTAMVSFDSAMIGIEDLKKIIKDTGYEVIKLSAEKTVEFKVIGMASDHCAGVVKKAVEKLEGVKEVETNFPNSYARVSYDESTLSAREIIRAISAAGYKPQLIEAGEEAADVEKEAREEEIRTLKKKFIWATIFAFPILYVAMSDLISMSLSGPFCPVSGGFFHSRDYCRLGLLPRRFSQSIQGFSEYGLTNRHGDLGCLFLQCIFCRSGVFGKGPGGKICKESLL
jgi:copper ion binding protein